MVTAARRPRMAIPLAICAAAWWLSVAGPGMADDAFARRQIASMRWVGAKIDFALDDLEDLEDPSSAASLIRDGEWEAAVERIEAVGVSLVSIAPLVGKSGAAQRKLARAENGLRKSVHGLALAWMEADISRVLEARPILLPADRVEDAQDEVRRISERLHELASRADDTDNTTVPPDFGHEALLDHLATAWPANDHANPAHPRKRLWLALVKPERHHLGAAEVIEVGNKTTDAHTWYLAGLALLELSTDARRDAKLTALRAAQRYMTQSQAAEAAGSEAARQSRGYAEQASLQQLALALGAVRTDEAFWSGWRAALGGDAASRPLDGLAASIPDLRRIPPGLHADVVGTLGRSAAAPEHGRALADYMRQSSSVDTDVLLGWLCTGLGLYESAVPYLTAAREAARGARYIHLSYLLGRAIEETTVPAPATENSLYQSAKVDAGNASFVPLDWDYDGASDAARETYATAVRQAAGLPALPAAADEEVEYMAQWLAADNVLDTLSSADAPTTGDVLWAAIRAMRACDASFNIRLRCFDLFRRRHYEWNQMRVMVYGATTKGSNLNGDLSYFEIAPTRPSDGGLMRLIQRVAVAQFFGGVRLGSTAPLSVDEMQHEELTSDWLRTTLLNTPPYNALPDIAAAPSEWNATMLALYRGIPAWAQLLPLLSVNTHYDRAAEFVRQ
ncbi:hypothetical protein HN766_06205, partial [Candidatus Poribacteria bacterium]|nr:hypothetical protein [Candidatus Poribacteria bacterium]